MVAVDASEYYFFFFQSRYFILQSLDVGDKWTMYLLCNFRKKKKNIWSITYNIMKNIGTHRYHQKEFLTDHQTCCKAFEIERWRFGTSTNNIHNYLVSTQSTYTYTANQQQTYTINLNLKIEINPINLNLKSVSML